MKLVIQIPCWNEEDTIKETIRSLPRNIDGIDSIEVVIIDDGSSDKTIEEAESAGVSEIVRLHRHQGLAAAFSAGVETAIERDADILVNTDADLQYPSAYILKIIEPILRKEADIVIGDRLSYEVRPFSRLKMFLEMFGTGIIRIFSGIPVKDAASGFRAFSKDVLYSMVIHDEFTYTLESILLAGIKKFRVVNVAVPINPQRRKSRLFKSIKQYVFRSIVTILRIYMMYHPLKFFSSIGLGFISMALIIGIRFLYFFLTGEGEGHIQSLILLAVLAGMGFQCIMLGMLGDVIAANRRLLEKLRIIELNNKSGYKLNVDNKETKKYKVAI